MTTIPARRSRPSSDRLRTLAWGALRYAVVLLVAFTIIVPIGYAVLGGFRDTGQLLNRTWA